VEARQQKNVCVWKCGEVWVRRDSDMKTGGGRKGGEVTERKLRLTVILFQNLLTHALHLPVGSRAHLDC